MNWTDRMRQERTRQINLGYTEQADDALPQDEWDRVLQTWYTFLLQDVLAHDIDGFRHHVLQLVTVAACWGAAEERFARKVNSGFEWHEARKEHDDAVAQDVVDAAEAYDSER